MENAEMNASHLAAKQAGPFFPFSFSLPPPSGARALGKICCKRWDGDMPSNALHFYGRENGFRQPFRLFRNAGNASEAICFTS